MSDNTDYLGGKRELRENEDVRKVSVSFPFTIVNVRKLSHMGKEDSRNVEKEFLYTFFYDI